MSDLRPGCPQTMQVYRSIAGELSRPEAEAFANHLAACAQCRQVKAEIEGARVDLPPVDHVWREPQPRSQRAPHWAVRTAVAAAAVGLSAAVFLFVPEGFRTKGGLDVELIVVREGRTIETTAFCPGDRLQPILRSPHDGLAYVFWLEGDEVRSMSPPVRIAANQRLIHPHSFELDDAGGTREPERLIIAVSELPEAELLEALREDPDRVVEHASLAWWPIEKSCR